MNNINYQSPYYPLFLNIARKKCVVVGGGLVALRKVESLVSHKAQVYVISPFFIQKLEDMQKDGLISLIKRPYQYGDIKGATLVIAATDDSEVNREIAHEAGKARVLINVVDKPDESDFIVPSYFSRGDIVIAVSTSGKSPALSRKLRTELEQLFGTEYAILADIIANTREKLKQSKVIIDPDKWQEAIDIEPLLKLINEDKSEQIEDILMKCLLEKPSNDK